MDGIDGIAGIQAATAAIGWLAVGLISRIPLISAAGILLGSSSLGFLFHNWQPAKVFMGDVGSAFLGYSYAVLPLVAGQLISSTLAGRLPLAGFLMVAPFVEDALFTFFSRLARREKLAHAHRSHLYQRLVISGLSHRSVALIYGALGLVGSCASLLFLYLDNRRLADIVALAAVTVIFGVPLGLVVDREKRATPVKTGA